MFQDMELSNSKIKKNSYIPEMELSSLIFFLYFGKELSELEKQKKIKTSYISGANLGSLKNKQK